MELIVLPPSRPDGIKNHDNLLMRTRTNDLIARIPPETLEGRLKSIGIVHDGLRNQILEEVDAWVRDHENREKPSYLAYFLFDSPGEN